MLPTRKILASLKEDRLVLILKELSLVRRLLSRAQRVERYYIPINPFTDRYERLAYPPHRSRLMGATKR